MNNWHYLLDKLEHVFQHSGQDQDIVFEINVIELLCSSAEDAKKFRSSPTLYLQQLTQFLHQSLGQRLSSDTPDKKASFAVQKKLASTYVHLKWLPYTQKLYRSFNQLNSDHVGSWIVITGTVIQAIQKKTLDKMKNFVCAQCGKVYRLTSSHQNGYRFELPALCENRVEKEGKGNIIAQLYANLNKRKNQGNKKQAQQQEPRLQKCSSTKFEPVQAQKICIDYQQLRIQQQFQYISSGKMPQTLTVLLEGKLCESAALRPGDDLTITGILSYRYKKLIRDYRILPQLVLVANNIVVEKSGNYVAGDGDKEEGSEAEMSKIYASFPLNIYSEYELTSKERVLIKQLEFRREIIESFCPAIYGRSMVKLGLLLSLLGGVSLENQSSKIRGHSHVLLVGEPGTGKSVLLKQIAKLADRSFFTNGIGTTSAGLSVSYYKQGGDWMIEAGALVLADNGVCCIDQLTLLSKKDQKSLLESMEQQTISSAKASVVGKLNARTTVICACNPTRPGQKYDEDLDLEANTGLSIPLLTRFDMIFIMKDERDISEDADKCDHILEKFCVNNNVNRKPSKQKIQKQPLNLKNLLKKSKSLQPDLHSHQLLTKYYTQQRKLDKKIKTARAFESLCRIAEAHAKLMLRESTVLLDYVTAICITENRYFTTIEEYYAILDQVNQRFKTDYK